MAVFERHLFICCNQRPLDHPRGSCDPDADDGLQKAFKKALAERGLQGRVRANKAGCLDQCEHGPTVVVYPDAVWYGFVRESDIDEIIDSHILGGTPIARLRLPDTCVNAATCPHKPRPRGANPDRPPSDIKP